jgi:large subunit ribosomal protein L23
MQHTIIIKPIITEQSMAAVNKGKFTFAVRIDADKKEIKGDIEKTFSVNVVGISTLVVKGKTKRVGTRRTEITQSSYKKAIVQLATGQKIGLFELGGEAR